MHSVIALGVGVLFGAGLALSGMTDTEKVLGFLDLAGEWDITLAFVMGGGLLVSFPAFHWAKRRKAPLVESIFHWPSAVDIDRRLIVGASLFGIGWGIYGYCPGPAISSLVYGHAETFVFVIAMLVGMALVELMGKPRMAESK